MPFQLGDIVKYSWSRDFHFAGQGRIVEILPDGRYRLDFLTAKYLSREASIFEEFQLRAISVEQLSEPQTQS